jgi:hypothetical protein
VSEKITRGTGSGLEISFVAVANGVNLELLIGAIFFEIDQIKQARAGKEQEDNR